MLPCGEHSSSTSGITESSSSLCLSNRSSRRFYNKEKDEQHIKLINTILHMFVLATRTICFQKNLYLSTSVWTYISQSTKYADGIIVTSYPCSLSCWWHQCHIMSLYSIMLTAKVTSYPCSLLCWEHKSHILSLYSFMSTSWDTSYPCNGNTHDANYLSSNVQ